MLGGLRVWPCSVLSRKMNGTDSKAELVTMEDSRLILCLGGFSVRREVDWLCEIDCEWTSCGLEGTTGWSIGCGLWSFEMLFCLALGFFAADRQKSVRLSSRNPTPF